MNRLIPLSILLFSLNMATYSQVTNTATLSTISNNSTLTAANNDDDNGDGAGDGAITLTNYTNTGPNGIDALIGGTMSTSQPITIITNVYNKTSSYINFTVALYNKTNDPSYSTPLTISNTLNIKTNTDPARNNPLETITLNYTPVAADAGDELVIRFERTGDHSKVRRFWIDNIKINGNFIPLSISTGGSGGTGGTGNNYPTCTPTVIPDLTLSTASQAEKDAIDTILDRLVTVYISSPTSYIPSNATNDYNALNISVTNDEIYSTVSLNSLQASAVYSKYDALKGFARSIRYSSTNANGLEAIEKSQNMLWFIAKESCANRITNYDTNGYSFSSNLVAGLLVAAKHIDAGLKNALLSFVEKDFTNYLHFWGTNYASYNNDNYQIAYETISTDRMYNDLPYIIAATNLYDTYDKKVRHMKAVKRYIERFLTITSSSTDGLKIDGSGFHHKAAYQNYLNCYKTISNILYELRGTPYQIDQQSYKNFRKGIYALLMQTNDAGILPYSMAGRKPQDREIEFQQNEFKKLATVGGQILGLSTPDPVLAGIYNRRYATPAEFNGYTTTSPYTEGFFQFNQGNTGVYRKDNWSVSAKGFTSYLAGAEIYKTQNRYGRYQSYGALEVLYQGDKITGNGYDYESWDWRYIPGATTIVHSWPNLQGYAERVDEFQAQKFAGSLAFDKIADPVLTETAGTYGLFGMNFKESKGNGFNTIYSPDTNNASFVFRKSNFFFGDYILCLASAITNNNSTNSTVTTLFQRLNNTGTSPKIDGTTRTSSVSNLNNTSNHWVLSNYNTGFYIVSSNGYDGTLKLKRETQQNPDQDTTTNASWTSTNTGDYYTAYIDHGTAPVNDGYEYIIKPNTNSNDMDALQTDISQNGTPYQIHARNSSVHIVEEKNKNLWGYSFFATQSNLSQPGSKVKAASAPCLLMVNDNTSSLKVAISNPDIGYTKKAQNNPTSETINITFHGDWSIINPVSGVAITSPPNSTETVVAFTLYDGLPKEVVLTDTTTMSTKSNKIIDGINIYPNPVKNVVNIQVPNNITISEYIIYNAAGNVVKQSNQIVNHKINIKGLNGGVYILKILDKNRNYTVKKLIVKP